MKKLLSIFLAFLAMFGAGASTVTNLFYDQFGRAPTVTLTITPIQAYISNPPYIVYGSPLTYTAINGVLNQQMILGDKTLRVGASSKTFLFSVPNDNATYNLNDLITTNIIYSFPVSPIYQLSISNNLSLLKDVTISNLADGDVPIWSTNSQRWVNGPQAGGGGSGVTTFNTRSGAVTLTLSDVTGALTYTPLNQASTNLLTDTNTFRTFTNSLGARAFDSTVYTPLTGFNSFSNTVSLSLANTNLYTLLSTFQTFTQSVANIYQPITTDLTQWAGTPTNLWTTLGQLGTFSNSLKTTYQTGSANLTNWSSLATNVLFTYLPGTNVIAVTNGNTVTFSATGGGSASMWNKVVALTNTYSTSSVMNYTTLPTSSQGVSVITNLFTGHASGNHLLIHFICMSGSSSATSFPIGGLFIDSNSNATEGTVFNADTFLGSAITLVSSFDIALTDTSPHAYIIRIGPASGTSTTIYINSLSTQSQYFGTTQKILLSIQEYTP